LLKKTNSHGKCPLLQKLKIVVKGVFSQEIGIGAWFAAAIMSIAAQTCYTRKSKREFFRYRIEAEPARSITDGKVVFCR